MQKKLIATPAIAGLVALPIAGYATFYLLREQPFQFGGDEKITETLADKPATVKPLTVGRAGRRRTKADADTRKPRRDRGACRAGLAAEIRIDRGRRLAQQ